jgi:hypothetical protein
VHVSGDGDRVRTPDEQSEWERRRRIAEIFGDALPETTSDERDDAPPEKDSATDRWLREQVPPHHGS